MAAVAGVAALVYSSATIDVPFFTRGEPREAMVVQVMLEGGSAFWPLRNATEIPSKPPMFHWLGYLAVIVCGGLHEFSARLPSVLSGALAAALTGLFGTRLFGPTVGVTAALIAGTCQAWMAAATTARVDMVLTVFLLLALVTFFGDYSRRRPLSHLFYFALTCAVFAKGPAVGLVLPAAIITLFLVWRRDGDYLLELKPFRLAAWSVLPLAWYIGGYLTHGAPFIAKLIVDENIYRVFDPKGDSVGHYAAFYTYVYLLPLGMAPWSLVLPSAVLSAWRARGGRDGAAVQFLLSWAFVTFVLMSLAGSKRAVYLLPSYPALAILSAAWWERFAGTRLEGARGPLYLTTAFLAVVPVVILAEACGIGALSWLSGFFSSSDRANAVVVVDSIRSSKGPMLAFSSMALIVAGGQVYMTATGRLRALMVCMGVLVAACYLMVTAAFLRPVAHSQSLRPMIEKVVAEVDPDARWISYRLVNYASVYYAARPIEYVEELPSRFPQHSTVVMTTQSSLEALRREAASRFGLSLRVRARHDYSGNPRRDPIVVLFGDHLGGEQSDDLILERNDGADRPQGDESEQEGVLGR